jgi:hypothetical protein
VAFDDQLRDSLDRLVASLRTHLETSVRAAAEELSQAAAVERKQASTEAAAAARSTVRDEMHRELAQAGDAAKRENEEFRRAAEMRIGELARSSDQVQAELATARAEIDRVRQDRDAARREAEESRRTARESAEEVLAAQLAMAAADSKLKLEAEIERVRQEQRDAEGSAATQLLAAVRSLDATRTLGEVLDVLTHCGGRNAERAAVLIVKDAHVQGWRFTGFTSIAPRPSSMLITIVDAGIIGEAVRAAAGATHVSADGESGGAHALPPFAQGIGGRYAVALPVIVGGVVVAVLYADTPDEGHAAGARWTAVLEVLTRHASRVLETTTLQQAVGLAPEPVARASHIS